MALALARSVAGQGSAGALRHLPSVRRAGAGWMSQARDDAYQRHKQEAAARQRRIAHEGRDIGKLPKIAQAKRREATRLDLRAFCDGYLKGTFSLPWSADHLRVLERART